MESGATTPARSVFSERSALLGDVQSQAERGEIQTKYNHRGRFTLNGLIISFLVHFVHNKHRSRLSTNNEHKMGKGQILPAFYRVATELRVVYVRVASFLCSNTLRFTIFRLGGDFLAGLSVACILIPQSISYATSLAKLSPLAGLVSFYLILRFQRFLSKTLSVLGSYSGNSLCFNGDVTSIECCT